MLINVEAHAGQWVYMFCKAASLFIELNVLEAPTMRTAYVPLPLKKFFLLCIIMQNSYCGNLYGECHYGKCSIRSVKVRARCEGLATHVKQMVR